MDTSLSRQPVSETQLEIADGIAVTEKGMEGFVCSEWRSEKLCSSFLHSSTVLLAAISGVMEYHENYPYVTVILLLMWENTWTSLRNDSRLS